MISVVINAYALNSIICCNIVSAKRRRLHQRKNTLRASLAASSGAHSFAIDAASANKRSKLGKVRRGMPKITTQERKKSIKKWSRGSHFCIKWPSMRRKNTLQDRFVPLERSEVVQGVFQLKHLVLFTKCTSLCPSIEMYLKNDYPLILKYTVANLGEVKLVLAPIKNKDGRWWYEYIMKI